MARCSQRSMISPRTLASGTSTMIPPSPDGVVAMLASTMPLQIVVALVLLVGCTTGPAAPSTAQDYIDEYGGSLNTIEFILGYTDCSILRQTHDNADANRVAFTVGTARSNEQLGRMSAALDRMEALGC